MAPAVPSAPSASPPSPPAIPVAGSGLAPFWHFVFGPQTRDPNGGHSGVRSGTSEGTLGKLSDRSRGYSAPVSAAASCHHQAHQGPALDQSRVRPRHVGQTATGQCGGRADSFLNAVRVVPSITGNPRRDTAYGPGLADRLHPHAHPWYRDIPCEGHKRADR